jgi:diguanylate cyclase (GGDEF)-like protein/PAS domain S-box-containing protein
VPPRTKASPKVHTAASRAAEARFRATFERAAIGIAHVSMEGVLLRVNAKLCEILGRREKSLIGRDAREFSHSEDRAAIDPYLPRLLGGEIESLSLEKRYLHRTGRAVWVRLSLALVRRKNGKPDYLIAMFEEISARRDAEQARDASRSLLQATLDSTAEGVLVTGLDRRITAWNARFLDLFGVDAEALAGRDIDQVLGSLAPKLSDVTATAASVDALYTDPEREARDEIAFADGRVVECHSVPQRSGGAVIGRVCSFQDITPRKRADEALRLSEDRLQCAVRGSGAGIWDWNVTEDRYYLSPRLKQILGYADAELPDNREETLRRIHPEDRPRVDEALRRHFSERTPYELEFRLQRKDGSYLWCRSVGQAVWDAEGKVLRFSGSTVDIDAQKRAEEKLAHLAHHDTLTGLPNRNLLRDRLPQVLSRARRNRQDVGMMFIDLDRFKVINDTLGHTVGDMLLVEVGRRLTHCTRGSDTVARLGGDEFAVLLPDLPDARTAGMVAQKILDTLAKPMQLDGHEVYVNASIGITLFPEDGEGEDILIRNADMAMYSAKERGRANYVFFSAEMNARTAQFLELESRLRQALTRDEFVLHYQPRINVQTGHITGAEALLRWRPNGSAKLVAPMEFIPLLEETGMIVPVGEWVLGAAFEQVLRCQARGLGPVPIAVNVSPRQFQRGELVPALRRLLAATGVAPRLIELEITETLVMLDTDYSVAAMREINELSVPLAIDDFGTGYSSLAYLKRFAIDRLKIDRSFIHDLASGANDAAIVTAVIAMAHKLGFGVVAEGVETQEQMEFLRACGCDELQGNLFSPAVEMEQFEALLAAQTWPVAQAG